MSATPRLLDRYKLMMRVENPLRPHGWRLLPSLCVVLMCAKPFRRWVIVVCRRLLLL